MDFRRLYLIQIVWIISEIFQNLFMHDDGCICVHYNATHLLIILDSLVNIFKQDSAYLIAISLSPSLISTSKLSKTSEFCWNQWSVNS